MVALPFRQSIGAKLFAAFIGMGLITAGLGFYSFYLLTQAGDIVTDTYDRPLMAINYARAASLDFAQMDKAELRREITPEVARAAIDRDIEQLKANLNDDLNVASQRSLAGDERKTIDKIRELVGQWDGMRRSTPERGSGLDLLARTIIDRFDLLTELTADHSFVERRKSVWAIDYFRYMSGAVSILALLLSAVITLLLARHIVRPLGAAAVIANRIANGELQTPIPAGGRDETGTLLRSMQVMQDNIRMVMEREQSQRRSAQNRLIDALESSREGMVLVDAAGHIAVANSQLARFFPELAGELVPGTDFATAFAKLHPQLVAIGDSGEFHLADGRWLRFTRSTTQDGGFFLFLSDFTDIKEREESLREAKYQAEAASTAKSQFVANISHELRTPLNAIIGFSEILAGQMFGKIENPQYVEYATHVLDSGRHLLNVINSVLDLAKSQAGNLELRTERVDLGSILRDCATAVRRNCIDAKLDLTVLVPEEALPLQADAVQLRRVFLNLLSNAVKFTEAGGKVTLHASLVRGSVQVEIIDTGIGMAAADIPLALTPFGQIDGRLQRRYEGAGLGLPLAKALVELHNGTMTIESERGQGTTVTVTLPQDGIEKIPHLRLIQA